MQLYKLFLIFLLFTYIFSICADGTGSSVEECFNREFSDEERDDNAVICCLVSPSNGEGDNICYYAKQVTYDQILNGKKDIETEGGSVVFHCKSEDKTTEKEKDSETETKTKTEKEKSTSASSNLALSLLILIFLGI